MRRTLGLIAIASAVGIPTMAAAQYYGDSNGYVSSTGSIYQYDLSRPSDQLRYEIDPGAQLRDSVNPRVELDRTLGQYGGGIR